MVYTFLPMVECGWNLKMPFGILIKSQNQTKFPVVSTSFCWVLGGYSEGTQRVPGAVARGPGQAWLPARSRSARHVNTSGASDTKALSSLQITEDQKDTRFCLAGGPKVLNLCILFLPLSQIGLVTRQPKYLISFANSYILIEAASVSTQCCQHKHGPLPSLCHAAVLPGPLTADTRGSHSDVSLIWLTFMWKGASL